MDLRQKIESKQVVIGVVGLGYVGLPLLIEFAREGVSVIGLDIDESKIQKLAKGESYIKHIPSEKIAKINAMGKTQYTSDFARSTEADVLLLALPTPQAMARE